MCQIWEQSIQYFLVITLVPLISWKVQSGSNKNSDQESTLTFTLYRQTPDKVEVINLNKLPKIQILEFFINLNMRHPVRSWLIRCVNMDLASLEDTEWTKICPQMDLWTDRQIRGGGWCGEIRDKGIIISFLKIHHECLRQIYQYCLTTPNNFCL